MYWRESLDLFAWWDPEEGKFQQTVEKDSNYRALFENKVEKKEKKFLGLIWLSAILVCEMFWNDCNLGRVYRNNF